MDPLNHYLHQDNCIWRAIGWVIPIEGGILASAFAKPGLPGFLIAILGIILILSFWVYCWKAGKDRDVNLPIIDEIKPKGFRLTYSAPWYLTGSFWFKIQFGTMLTLNIFICILEYAKWHCLWECTTKLFFD